MNVNVFIVVPTGIGCEIGGHCGDGNAPARLLGASWQTLVLHPNVVNASDINHTGNRGNKVVNYKLIIAPNGANVRFHENHCLQDNPSVNGNW